MIKVLIGEKGSGKTKALIESVNNAVSEAKGDIVFISCDTKRHMHDISHKVRMVDTSGFALKSYDEFYGFLCGLISNNYDMSNVYIDSIFKIVGTQTDGLEKFFEDIEGLVKHYNISFLFTISMDAGKAPEYIKKYV